MNTNRILAIMTPILLVSLCACGDNGGTEEPRFIRQFSAGDIDPFGCPFVAPVPWVSEEVHQDVCGTGCMPAQADGDFVACFGESVPEPQSSGTVAPARVTLCHPVSRQRHSFANSVVAEKFGLVCLGVCTDEGVVPFGVMVPEGCFEE